MIENVNLYGGGVVSVGIDYSMSSPAICLSYNEDVSWSTCKIFYLTNKKNYWSTDTYRLVVPAGKVSFTKQLDNGASEFG